MKIRKAGLPVMMLIGLGVCGGMACNEQQAENVKIENDAAIAQQESVALGVNNPELVKAGADGSLRLTAENGQGTGPGIKYMPEWKAFGWFGSDDLVEWEVEVPADGKYAAHLEWSVSDEEAGKEFLLEAGDQKVTGIVGKSGSWETFAEASIGEIPLKKGTQKIVFKPAQSFGASGALLDLREVKLVPVK